MIALKGLLAGLIAYAAILALLYFGQRRIMYFPDTQSIAPAAAGYGQAQAQVVKTADGESIVIWFAQPQAGQPLFLYFHGNGGQIAGRAARFRQLTRDGAGLLAVSYRGYGGSTGSPGEDGLIADAIAAYQYAIASGIEARRLVLIGESLGSGVAIALAAQADVGALVLEAPFSSTADIAAAAYWMFPVRMLMHDQFRSDIRIRQVKAPVLIIHGGRDTIVPVRFGEKLFALANEPKKFIRVENAGHQPLDIPATMNRMKEWIFETMR